MASDTSALKKLILNKTFINQKNLKKIKKNNLITDYKE